MVGCFGDINRRIDEEAFAPVLGASNHPLEFIVFVSRVDRLGDRIERRLTEYAPKEVLQSLRRIDLDSTELTLHRVKESGG